jgi:hypothetical protein
LSRPAGAIDHPLAVEPRSEMDSLADIHQRRDVMVHP